MRRMIWYCLIIFFTAMGIGACVSRHGTKDTNSSSDFLAVKDLNESLRLTYVDYINEGHIKSRVFLEVRNYSNKSIWFPDDWGVKIYKEEKSDWVEIPNSITYIQSEDLILAPYGDKELRDIGAPGVDPEISNNGLPISIRVVVIGNTMKGDEISDEQVAAYVDITLQP